MRTGRVRTRAEFDALRQRGVRSRRGTVRVTCVPGGDEVRVAFAIGRPVGSAVARNRLRRRLRALVRELDPQAGTYLVGAAPAAAALPYGELRAELAAALGDLA